MGRVQEQDEERGKMADDAERGWFAASSRRLGYPAVDDRAIHGWRVYVHVSVSYHHFLISDLGMTEPPQGWNMQKNTAEEHRYTYFMMSDRRRGTNSTIENDLYG